MAHILVVEDEEAISYLIRKNLELVGYTCSQVYDGKKALQVLNEEKFDLVLLDVMLPNLSGFELIKHIHGTPVIFITAKSNLEDKVFGLTSGAEDYIVKPFEIIELIARIHIVLRRGKSGNDKVTIDDVHVDLGSKIVKVRDEILDLTPQEYSLLEVLIMNRNLAMSREKLLELAWGFDFEGDTRTVDVHIQKLRKKLGLEEQIKTIFKLGYRLEI
jgi:DNA-binding response OmpR family regulator